MVFLPKHAAFQEMINDQWCLLSAHFGPGTIPSAYLEFTNFLRLPKCCEKDPIFTLILQMRKLRPKEVE